jgi:hypothetical protein
VGSICENDGRGRFGHAAARLGRRPRLGQRPPVLAGVPRRVGPAPLAGGVPSLPRRSAGPHGGGGRWPAGC